jgi:outer membrane biosynthesis protein TonB
MLPWLPKKLNKRQLFFCKLLMLIFVCHVIFLAAYFICSRSKVMTIKMQMPRVDFSRPITVIPFVRRTGQLNRLVQGSSKNKVAVKKTSSKNVPKKIAPPLKKKKAVVVKKAQPQKKSSPKKEQKKEVKKVEPQKKTDTNGEKKGGQVEKANKKVEEDVGKRLKQDGAVAEKGGAVASPSVENSDNNEPIVLGQEEFEALNVYQDVHRELSTHWHPPSGLHPKQPMIVLVGIDKFGKSCSMSVEQSSGVLVYDVAARMAVGKAVFSQQLWGQYIRLHF